MAQVHIWLSETEHHCCGERRAVGERLRAMVVGGRRVNWELRHYQGMSVDDNHLVDVDGVVTEIFRHRTVHQFLGEVSWRQVGFLPGVSVEATGDLDDDDDDEDEGDYEFVVDIGDGTIPAGLSTARSEPVHGMPVHIGFFDDDHNLRADDDEPFWFGFYNGDESFVQLQVSPRFADAADAVEWWSSYTDDITVSLGEPDERLRVTHGTSTSLPGPFFDPLDPRGRQSGARETALQHRMHKESQRREAMASRMVADGAEVRRRREALGLSIDELATRSGLSAERISSLETGNDDSYGDFRAWSDIAWALTEPWPTLRDRVNSLGPQGVLMRPMMSPLERADWAIEQLLDQFGLDEE